MAPLMGELPPTSLPCTNGVGAEPSTTDAPMSRYVSAMEWNADSWNSRGANQRPASMTITEAPERATSRAAALPAGPLPMMTTSARRSSVRWTWRPSMRSLTRASGPWSAPQGR
jgi:hypothetical protein